MFWEAFLNKLHNLRLDYVHYIYVTLGLIFVEALIAGWQNSSLRKIFAGNKSIKIDLFYTLLGLFKINSVIIFITTGGLFVYLSALLEKHHLQLFVIHNNVAQFATGFMITSFCAYWQHRLFHTIPVLWEAHRVHHSATDFNILLTHRFHPLERGMDNIVHLLSFLLIGANPETFFVFMIVDDILGQLQHARVKWDFGILGKLLLSPKAHLLHHSLLPENYNANYGGRLVLWDQIFGTYSDKEIPFEAIGVDRNDYDKESLFYSLINPYKALFLWLKGKIWAT